MKNIFMISCLCILLSGNLTAQRDVDLMGLRQIVAKYSYVLEKDELYNQVVEMGPAESSISIMKQTYADVIKNSPDDSISIEVKSAEAKLYMFNSSINSRYPLNGITAKVLGYLDDAMRDGRNGKIMKEDPDNKYSGTWSDIKSHIKDAQIALQILKLKKGESDTAYVNNIARIKKCESDIEVLKNETRAILPVKKPIAPLPDIYKGTDRESLKAKVKELFAKECDKYNIYRVYLVSEWDRSKGIQWDDFTKSFKKYDKSYLEIDIICTKKGEAKPTGGFVVSYTLNKDNISGKVYDTVLCDYLEDRPILLSKVK